MHGIVERSASVEDIPYVDVIVVPFKEYDHVDLARGEGGGQREKGLAVGSPTVHPVNVELRQSGVVQEVHLERLVPVDHSLAESIPERGENIGEFVGI